MSDTLTTAAMSRAVIVLQQLTRAWSQRVAPIERPEVAHFHTHGTSLHRGLALGVIHFKPVLSAWWELLQSLPSAPCTLSKARHDRCTFRHFYFSKNVLASWTVLKHAHSSTDSSCMVITTVNIGQTHQVTTALRVCILYLFATDRKSQQVKHLLTPTG